MSSRVFKARTGHTVSNPQKCGLSDREIEEGDNILYLVCAGADARPEYQIKVTREEKKVYSFKGRTRTKYEKDYGMGDGRVFRTVFGGWQQNPDTGKREKVFSWQEYKGKDSDGEEIWNPLKCWSHIALADVADRLGYDVRKKNNGRWKTTSAHEGDRAIGNEHTVDEEGENAMVVLARAVLTDEEAGLVAPGTKADPDAEDRKDAEAFGMTLEAYRTALARNA